MAIPRPFNETGQRLRSLREARGISGRELARRLGQDQSRVSRIESGRIYPALDDVEAFAKALGLTRAEKSDLLALRGLYESEVVTAPTGRIAVQQERIAELEWTTKEFRFFDTVTVPGMLQTADLARYLVRGFPGAGDEEGFVASRAKRQRILDDPKRTFDFVIMESALRNLLCPPGILAEQLRWIRHQMKAHRNLVVTVVPADTPLPYTPTATYSILDSKLVVSDTMVGFITYRREEDVALHRSFFDRFKSIGAGGENAGVLIDSIAADLARKATIPGFGQPWPY